MIIINDGDITKAIGRIFGEVVLVGLSATVLMQGWGWFIAPWIHLESMPFFVALGITASVDAFRAVDAVSPITDFGEVFAKKSILLIVGLFTMWVIHIVWLATPV